MEVGIFQQYARQRGISLRDASQTFFQVIVLKHLSYPEAILIGGTALVLGHGNPRFSEDVDLTQVSDVSVLRPGLVRAATELRRWLNKDVSITTPKKDGRTWRLTCQLSPAESIRLHVDAQQYRAYSSSPIVVQFPSIPTFVCRGMGLEEIMAEKVISLAFRNYLGGRDLFDLWFHWLRSDDWAAKLVSIKDYVSKKLIDRSLSMDDFLYHLSRRLSSKTISKRVQSEWERYLTDPFQDKMIHKEIILACSRIPEVFSK